MQNPKLYYISKEEYVKDIFTSIAHKYDLMNTIMTLNLDQSWRRFCVEQANPQDGDRCLDVCCGTAKLTIELAKRVGPDGQVIGVDFCPEMLEVGRKNVLATQYHDRIKLLQGNALNLPFADNSFHCATIAFALRNVPDIEMTLREMMRVVKSGGRVVSLELAKPTLPIFKQLYYLYFDNIVPLLGKIKAKQEDAYRYLPHSLKNYPHQKEIKKLFSRIGLIDVQCHELTGGIVAVHVGTKP